MSEEKKKAGSGNLRAVWRLRGTATNCNERPNWLFKIEAPNPKAEMPFKSSVDEAETSIAAMRSDREGNLTVRFWRSMTLLTASTAVYCAKKFAKARVF